MSRRDAFGMALNDQRFLTDRVRDEAEVLRIAVDAVRNSGLLTTLVHVVRDFEPLATPCLLKPDPPREKFGILAAWTTRMIH